MELYPYQPQSTVPIRSIQAICRCSTKKRAVLRPFSISSASLLCAMDASPSSSEMAADSYGSSLACQVCLGSRNYLDFIAILNQRAARDDDRFSRLKAFRNADQIPLCVPNFYCSLAGNAFSGRIGDDKYS